MASYWNPLLVDIQHIIANQASMFKYMGQTFSLGVVGMTSMNIGNVSSSHPWRTVSLASPNRQGAWHPHELHRDKGHLSEGVRLAVEANKQDWESLENSAGPFPESSLVDFISLAFKYLLN